MPYLTETAFADTAGFIAAMPAGTGLVFDYALARSSLSFVERLALDALSAAVARAGEPFQLFFEPRVLANQLRQMGFQHLEDLSIDEINPRYFRDRADGFHLTRSLGHLMSAGT